MTQDDWRMKVKKVKTGESRSEIFDKVRPPEEFGDAVELFYNEQKQCFYAKVIDPYTREVFSEKDIEGEENVVAFIQSVVK
ncbi:hypothetical protein [Bacillus sp. FJAT-47783]|uniref:hypothetical protein n=1 Tax=Bacillus sp. FJAT-47783 TaxID=2922712 RepID=UPI001FAC4FBB|nr:hypothetical protein [Bacillus sp. FJAT-47783]